MSARASIKNFYLSSIVLLMAIITIPASVVAAGNPKSVTPQQSVHRSHLPTAEQHLARSHRYSPDELLVKFRPGINASNADAAARNSGAISVQQFKRPRKLKSSRIDSWRLLKVNKNSLAIVRARLLKDSRVEHVEYNYEVRIVATPNDPSLSQLWGLNNTGQTGGAVDADIDAPEAWDVQTGSSSVVIAVIDTGVDYTHPDLAANIWTNPGEIAGNGIDDDGNGYVDDVHGYDFANLDSDPMDDHGHGTHVSGTIAAVGNNGIGVVGVNWSARVMGVKFLSASGSGSTSGAISAVLYASNMGAKVMNNSWGGGGFSQALEDAIATSDAAGSLFIAAAGNSNSNNDSTPHYPSSYDVPNIVAVAATDHLDAKASFSSYGATSVDLSAPGVNIYSTEPTIGDPCCSSPSGYGSLSGTSMATPHVAGAAALLIAQFPTDTNAAIKNRLLGAVDPVASMQGITVTGGRLNTFNAFENDTIPPAAVIDLALASAGGRSITLGWSATGDDGMAGKASAYDLRYSTTPIDASNFDLAVAATGLPTPGASGASEIFKVAGLESNTTYFFAIKVIDNVGNIGAISNVTTATTLPVSAVFSDDMESGEANWTISGGDGVGGPALWHLSTHRAASPSAAFYYGREDTLTYNTGAINTGTITSKPIDLNAVSDATLIFNHFLQTENLSPYDSASVEISADGGNNWSLLMLNSLGTGGQMLPVELDISTYKGKVIQLRFAFNTLDSALNDFEGWVVDDVVVVGVVENDTTPPATVTNLTAPNVSITTVDLTWTATGDDGVVGQATSYDLRYSLAPIDAGNFDQATPIAEVPVPAQPGAAELFKVSNLLGETNYYFALKVIDNLGNKSLLSNVVNITTLPGSYGTIFFDDMESGLSNWSIEGIDGQGGPALWHLSTNRSRSLNTALYYGREETLNYDTGVRNYGSVTSKPIDLTTVDGAKLELWRFLMTENLEPYDSARIQVSVDQGASWVDVHKTSMSFTQSTVTLEVDLSEFDGKIILLRFFFDTVDGAVNYYEGWVIDDVTITGWGPNLPNLPPVAVPQVPTAGPIGQPIQFKGWYSFDPEGQTLSYLWNFGDGATSTDVLPTHAYATQGAYTVTLVVNDGAQNSQPVSKDISIGNTLPIADAGNGYNAKRNQLITFDGTGSHDSDGDPLTYKWDFGDGSTGTGVTPTHSYTNLGTYTITLVVNDGLVDSAPDSTYVNISNQVPIAKAGGPYSGIRNQVLTFDGSGSSDADGDPLTYAWNFGDGTTGTGVSPSHSYATIGNYTVTLVVNDGFTDSYSASSSVKIVNQVPIANVGGPYSGEYNQPIVFDGTKSSDADGDPLTYQWNFGDGSTGTGSTPSHIYAKPGNYTVYLVVNDGYANSATVMTSVSVTNQLPVANAGGPYSAPYTQAIVFDGSLSSDPEGQVLTYQWDFGDGSIGTGVAPSHTYSAAGTYNVTLIVNDGLINSVPSSAGVVITNEAPIANAGGPYNGVRNQVIAFNGSLSSDPEGQVLTYQWEFGDGTIGTGVAPSHVYANSGSYNVTLIVNDGLISSATSSASVVITNQVPVANAGGPYSADRVQTLTLDGSASTDPNGDALTYQWDFGDGSTATGIAPVHTYSSLGTFTVTLVVNDGEASSAPVTTTVTVSNISPVANAGPDQAVPELTEVTLDGRDSQDPDGTITGYSWKQISGDKKIKLKNDNTVQPNFKAPKVPSGQTYRLDFELTVTDNDNATNVDQVRIIVQSTP